MTKTTRLRRDILARRDRLAPQTRVRKSERIARRLLAHGDIRRSNDIFIYVSFRSEVETLPIIAELLRRHKRVSVPRTRVAEKRLDVVAIADPARDLAPGYCQIPEPTEAVAAANRLDPATLDLVILPGSVFDERGGRFGYGGGYYDRLLAAIPHACRVALAFDLQVVDNLPLKDHDQLLDRIVTETRVIDTASRGRC